MFAQPSRELESAIGQDRGIDPLQAGVVRGGQDGCRWGARGAEKLGVLCEHGQTRRKLGIGFIAGQADVQSDAASFRGEPGQIDRGRIVVIKAEHDAPAGPITQHV